MPARTGTSYAGNAPPTMIAPPCHVVNCSNFPAGHERARSTPWRTRDGAAPVAAAHGSTHLAGTPTAGAYRSTGLLGRSP